MITDRLAELAALFVVGMWTGWTIRGYANERPGMYWMVLLVGCGMAALLISKLN